MGIGKKIFLLTIGTMIAAFGIDLAIHAGFGGATLAVLWQGISRTFGMTLGTDTIEPRFPTVKATVFVPLCGFLFNYFQDFQTGLCAGWGFWPAAYQILLDKQQIA